MTISTSFMVRLHFELDLKLVLMIVIVELGEYHRFSLGYSTYLERSN